MFQQCVQQRVNEVTAGLAVKQQGTGIPSNGKTKVTRTTGLKVIAKNKTPTKQKYNLSETIKSPSDTTLYAPALNMTPQVRQKHNMTYKPGEHVQHNEALVNQISDFVQSVWIETKRRDSPEVVRQLEPPMKAQWANEPEPSISGTQPGEDPSTQARGITEEHVIQAEQYKVVIRKPEGGFDIICNPNMNMAISNVNNSQTLVVAGNVVDTIQYLPPNQMSPHAEDDEFFHLTCHIDNVMRNKIERGDYVELEKLLPKGKGISQRFSEGKLHAAGEQRRLFFLGTCRERKNWFSLQMGTSIPHLCCYI